MIRVDLNLLRVFDVLMELRSVSRAAARLGLTQSAVSHALGRLREQIGDPLFVRTRGGLRPTQHAHEIAPAIHDGLATLRDAIQPSEFDPATSTRIFTISASSYFCVILLPHVIERARIEAPHAQFRIIAPPTDLQAGFEDGTLDAALGSFDHHPASLTKAALFSEQLVWIGRAGSGGDLATRPRLAIGRSMVAFLPDGEEPERRSEPRVGVFATNPATAGGPVSTHDPLSAGMLVATSDLVTLWPRQLAAMLATQSNVEILGPHDQGPVELSMLWPARLTGDAAHRWLRELLIEAAAKLDADAVA